MEFKAQFLILLYFSVQYLKKNFAQECIGIDRTVTSECSFCAEGFLKLNDYESSGPDDFNSVPAFFISKCIKKSTGSETGEIEIFVGSQDCDVSAQCLGTKMNPYGNFFQGLQAAHSFAKNYQTSKITITLIEKEYYLLEIDLNKYFNQYTHVLRRSNSSIVIRPDPQSQTAAILYLKTSKFFIFVSGNLLLKYIIFDGTDLNLKEEHICRSKKTICCTPDNEKECGLIGQSIITPSPNWNLGLLNIEYLFDEGKKAAPFTPEIVISDSTFINLVSLDAKTGFASLLSFEKGLPGRLNIINSTFYNCLFYYGLLSVQAARNSSFFNIFSNSSFVFSYSVLYNDNIKSTVKVSGSTISKINNAKGVVFEKIYALALFFILHVELDFEFSNNSISQILNPEFGLLWALGSDSKQLNASILFLGNIFDSNGICYVADVSYFMKIIFQENILKNNTWEMLLNITSTLSFLQNVTFKDSTFKGDKIFLIQETKIFLISVIFQNATCLVTPAYLFYSYSRLSVSMDDIINNYFPLEIAYTHDYIIFEKSVFKNTNFLIFRNFEAIYAIEISNCLFSDLSPLSEFPLFMFSAEYQFAVNNTEFIRIKNIGSFIVATYSKNLSFISSSISDSNLFDGFDVFIASRIEGQNKVICNFTNSNFRNIQIYKPPESSLRFIQFHLFSRECGFYLAIFANCVFVEIVCQNCRPDDYLFYTATQIILFVDSKFIDIGGLSLKQYFPRYPELSEFRVRRCLYILKRYAVYLLMLTSLDYYPRIVIIEDSIIEGGKQIEGNNALSFLNIEKFILKNSTIKNINCRAGNTITVKTQFLNWLLVESCRFSNNSGMGVPADLVMETSYDLGFEWLDLKEDPSTLDFGILNTIFEFSATGSLGVIKNSQLMLINCSFYRIGGMHGGILSTLSGASIVMKDVAINESIVEGMGGAFYLFESNLVLLNVKVVETSSKDFGGLIASFSSTIIIQDCIFYQVSSANLGGGIWADKSFIITQDTIFTNGTSGIEGGHFYIKSSILSLTNIKLQKGSSISASSILSLASQIIIDKVELSECASSLTKGSGAIVISGNLGQNIKINYLSCTDSKAMTGSCLHVSDANIDIVNGIFSRNRGDQGSVIHIASGNWSAKMLLDSCKFKNNDEGQGLISSELANVAINSSLFVDNSVTQYYLRIHVGTLEIYNSKLVFSNKSIDSSEVTLILIRDTELVTFLMLEISGLSFASLIMVESCPLLKIFNVIASKGFSRHQGGGFSLINSSVYIRNTSFYNNKALFRGGTLFISLSSVSMTENIFLNNQAEFGGADMYVANDNKKEIKVLLIINTFSNFNGSSVFSLRSQLSISKSNFSNNLIGFNTGFSAIMIEECINLTILAVIFKNSSQESVILITNKINIGLLIVQDSIFILETVKIENRLNGGFLNILGPCKVFIRNSRFQGGNTEGSGGAIAYVCSIKGNESCILSLEGKTEFLNNMAKLNGMSIYSPFTNLSIGDLVNINKTLGSREILTKASSIIVLRDIISEEDIVLKARENIENYLRDPEKDISEAIISKSGLKFKLGIILIDEYGNSLDEISEGAVEFQLDRASSDSDGTLQASVCKIENGFCIVRQISLIGKPLSIFNLLLKYTSQDFEITRSLSIHLIYCSKGEVVIDRICVPCSENFYSLAEIITENPQLQCIQCPKNADCPGGSLIIPKAGFWRYDEASNIILACFSGAKGCPYQQSWKDQGNSKLTFTCGKEYYGNLCKMCKIDYAPYYDGCYSCSKDIFQIFSFSAKLLFVIALISWQCHTLLFEDRSRHKIFIRLLVWHTNYMIAFVNLNLKRPIEFKDVIGYLNYNISLIPADIFEFECLIRKIVNQEHMFFVNSYLRLTSILFYAAFAFILKTVIEFFTHFRKRKSLVFLKKFRKRASYSIFVVFIITFRMVYPRVLKFMISILNCIDIGTKDGKQVMFENPNIICYENDHISLIFGITITGIIFWSILVPSIIFKYIHRRRSWLGKRSNFIASLRGLTKRKSMLKGERRSTTLRTAPIRAFETVLNSKDELNTQPMHVPKKDRLFFILTYEYRNQTYYWELVENLIIFLLLLISQYISDLDDIIKRLIIFICFCLVFLLYQYKQPFLEWIHLRSKYFSIIIILTTITFDLIASIPETSYTTKQLSKIVVFTINAGFYGIFIFLIIFSVAQSNRGFLSKLLRRKEKKFAKKHPVLFL